MVVAGLGGVDLARGREGHARAVVPGAGRDFLGARIAVVGGAAGERLREQPLQLRHALLDLARIDPLAPRVEREVGRLGREHEAGQWSGLHDRSQQPEGEGSEGLAHVSG